MLTEGVKCGEVESGAEASAYHRGESAAPELAEGVGAAGDVAEGVDKRGGTGLLDAGLEEIGGLEEGGGEDAGAEAGDEVECCGEVSIVSELDGYDEIYKTMPALIALLTCPNNGY